MTWYIYALASAILVSVISIIEKKSLLKEHAMKFVTVLALFNILLSFVYISEVDFSISGTTLFYIGLSALFGSLAFLFVAKGMRHMQISLASPMLNLTPGFTAILAFILLGERITEYQLAGIILLIIGTYVLEVDHSAKTLLEPIKKLWHSKYIHFIIFAAFMYGLGSIIDKKVLNLGTNIFTMLFFAHLFIGVYYLIFISVYYGGIKDVVAGIKKSGKYIFVIAVLVTLNRLVFLQAMSLALVSLAVPIKRLSTLFTTILGGTFFHEKGLKLKIIACAIMLGGVILVVAGF